MGIVSSLGVRVYGDTSDLAKAFDEAARQLRSFSGSGSSAFKGAETGMEGLMTKAAALGSFLGNLGARLVELGARFAFNTVTDAFGQAITLSSQFNNALIGLNSVAGAFGTNTDAAAAAARSLAADGLMPLSSAALGLKNLLAAGFNLEQSVNLMNAFKDSAAFGRIGALSFGDAVRSATEGVKNGNSILVDNAGVTKNLAQILKEAGHGQGSLGLIASDTAVRMALYNGILGETQAQTGDAAKLTETFSGQMSKLDTQWKMMLANLGDAITQNQTVAAAMGMVSEGFAKVTGWLAENGRGFNFVSDTIIAFVRVVAGAVDAVNFLHTAFNGLDTALKAIARGFLVTISSLTGPLIKLIEIGSKVPGSGMVFGLLANEIGSLYAVQTLATTGAENLRTSMLANDSSTASWTETTSGLSTRIRGMADDLTETRGKTVAFADGVNTVTKSATAGAAAVGNLGKQAKGLSDVLDKMPKVNTMGLGGSELGAGIPWMNPYPATTTPMQGSQFDFSGGETRWSGINQMPGADMSFMSPEDYARIFTPPPGMFQTLAAKLKMDAGPSMMEAGLFGAKSLIDALGVGIGTGDWSGFTNALRTGLQSFATSAIVSGINLLVPGLGSLLSPLIGGLTNLIGGLFDRHKGRDSVVAFAEEMGGFNALHAKLLEVGAAGEAAWIKLTQGTPSGNKDIAKTNIQMVIDLLNQQKAVGATAVDALNTDLGGIAGAAAPAKASLEELIRLQMELSQRGWTGGGINPGGLYSPGEVAHHAPGDIIDANTGGTAGYYGGSHVASHGAGDITNATTGATVARYGGSAAPARMTSVGVNPAAAPVINMTVNGSADKDFARRLLQAIGDGGSLYSLARGTLA